MSKENADRPPASIQRLFAAAKRNGEDRFTVLEELEREVTAVVAEILAALKLVELEPYGTLSTETWQAVFRAIKSAESI